MAVPKAVKKAAEEAQRLFEQRNGDPAVVETPESPPTDQTPDPHEVETDPPPAPVEAKPENWELRYRNYKAGTDETIHQLRQEAAALRGEVAALKEKQVEATHASSSGFLTDEEREEYGDLAVLIERVAKAMVERELAPTRQKVDSIAERSAETERDRFEDGLTRRVKDWKVINEDPRFIAWLNEVDDFSGQQRTVLIHHAAAARDVDRVAAFFTAFTKEFPNGGTPPAQPKRDPKERELAGNHRGDGDPPASTQKRTYSNDEIRALYDKKRRGVYKGRDQEWRAIEADISAAVTEGRIR